MPNQLPPLAAIRVFESVARHLSFTRAAVELGMTQAAVSYQIKVLEERIGAPLFLRKPRQIELTETGQRLAPRVRDAFDGLRAAFASLGGGGEGTLTISTMQTIASQWLAPRLGSFQIEHPRVAVRVETTGDLVDFSREQVDIAIRSGRGDWRGLVSHEIIPARFTAMASPALLDRIGPLAGPAAMLDHPLLEPGDVWWRQWFEAAGVDATGLSARTDTSLGNQSLIALAAAAGHGIALLSVELFQRELADRRLVRLFPINVEEERNYWLVYAESRRNVAKIRAFRNWMLAEIAKDKAAEHGTTA